MSKLSGKISYDFFSYCLLKKLKFDIAILQIRHLKSIKAMDLKPVSVDKMMSKIFGDFFF